MPIRFLATLTASALLSLALGVTAGCNEVNVSDRDLVEVREPAVAAAVDDPEIVIVDVRTPTRYAEGHIPTAINIPLRDVRASMPELATAQQIIVYAGGWTDPLSAAAAKKLISLGYTNVGEFRGGVELWQDAGYELATTEAET